jgi:hypothetical protein
MLEVIKFLTDFIRIDILVAFGLYSILFFIVRQFLNKKDSINEFDRNACKIVIYSGIAFAILWIAGNFLFYFQVADEFEKQTIVQNLTGKYWSGYLIQPLFWIILTQLFRIKFIRKFLIFRLIISLSFVITFERLVILATSINRGNLSNSPSIGFDLGLNSLEVIVGLMLKLLIFTLIVSVFHFGKQKLKRSTTKAMRSCQHPHARANSH